ncbi:MAG: riboflavin biosynthesis protein RibF [Opitutaceae bacterium]|nr:riboflavin biosynthesis protein RibF [Opitutaceae bacterium]
MSPAARIFRDLAGIQLPDRPCHVAVGMFDGVHRGHQAVIEAAVHAARRAGGIAGVFTFWPHPSRLFRPEDPVRMIFTAAERAELLLGLGADFIIEQPFTREFASIEADQVVPHLKRAMPPLQALYVGENWRFGRGRAGDVAALVTCARREGVDVVSAARLRFNGEPISSTRIRLLLESGDVAAAAELLGHPYIAVGGVVPGRQLGRTIQFPTLNLDWRPDLKPARGVYAVRIRGVMGGAPRAGVANYGVRPTVDGTGDPVLEVHIIGDCPFTTGDTLRVELVRHLRAERRFDSIDQLREQIARDREAAQAILI